MLAKQTYLKTLTVVSCKQQGPSLSLNDAITSMTDVTSQYDTHIYTFSDGSVKHVLDPFHISSATLTF